MLRLLFFAAVTWLASDLGYASFRPELTISLIWPVTGVALIWVGTGSRRTWPGDLLAIAAVVVGALLVADATWQVATVAAVQVVAQTLVHVLVQGRLAPDLWGAGGTRPVLSLRDLSVFLLAAVAGTSVGALLRFSGLGLIPTPTAVDAALVWVRNFSWAFVIGAVALQVVPLLRDGVRGGAVERRAQEWWSGWPTRQGETVLLLGVSAVVYLAVLSQTDPFPISFALMLPSLWAALRLPPPVASVHALLCGVFASTMTLAGLGVFGAVANALVGATMAQAFMVAVMLTSLIVSLITAERIAAVEESAQRANLLSAVLEQIREGIMVVRDDREVTLRNHALAELTGDERPLVGERLVDFTAYDGSGDEVAPDHLPYARALRGEEVVREELVVPTQDGDRKVLEISASRLPSREELAQALVVVRDVTLVRQREDSLASFAGVVAHDLNNPLTIVSGWADALGDLFAEGDVDGATGRDMTRRIQDASLHMRAFIDDLLAYTIARDQPLRLQDLDLSELTEQLARLRRDGPGHPEILVQPDIQVRGDEVLVRQLVDNLVGNAVKYVADGERARVTVSAVPRGEMVEVMVSDNGVGIPRAQRERIFETFVRAHGGEYAGTGIGLGICRRVVQRHGGRIRVEDNPEGVGSRFVLTLPSPEAAPSAAPGATAAPTSVESQAEPG